MRETFLPYNLASIGSEEIDAVVEVLKSGWLTTGARVQQFEAAAREATGAAHAVALSSCTAGLHLSLVALGIGPGDEVIVPDMTFCATANVVIHTGATPVIVDVVRDTYHIDPDAIERAWTPRTKAVIPVHYGGQACDMDRIMDFARRRGVSVIEDAAHAIGVTYRGRRIGTIGAATSFSFYVTKNVTSAEGGIVTTDDEKTAERIRRLTLHGISRDAWKRYSAEGSWRYDVLEAGFKCNLTDLHAALGVVQLRRMETLHQRRAYLAQRMTDGLRSLRGVGLPRARAGSSSNWHLYVIEIDEESARISRDAFIDRMRRNNIGTSVHYIPLHRHPAYRPYLRQDDDFPVSDDIYRRIVSLPLYPEMSDGDVDDVVATVRDLVC